MKKGDKIMTKPKNQMGGGGLYALNLKLLLLRKVLRT